MTGKLLGPRPPRTGDTDKANGYFGLSSACNLGLGIEDL